MKVKKRGDVEVEDIYLMHKQRVAGKCVRKNRNKLPVMRATTPLSSEYL